jgi:hypothetical protein
VAGHGQDEIIYRTLNPAGIYDGVPMNAFACFDCGYVDLRVDMGRLGNTTKMELTKQV